ncbi:MAG: glycosyltransferase family 4 protein [Mastigocoleus sp. MO_167.B18]|nr:glycosyltransferase family 4 protein [Mastigocoleus sp. MO_167.B18]
MPKQLRILYASGPEDVIEAYNFWIQNQDVPSQVSVPYCRQFYEVCRALDARAYVIAPTRKSEYLHKEQFIVESCPVPIKNASGIVYHLQQLWCALRLLVRAIRFRANVAVISSGNTHWFLLPIFSWLGINVVPSLHCVLWRKYAAKSLSDKLSLQLGSYFFRKKCRGILTVSHDIAKQVDELTRGEHPPIFEFFPTFRQADFVNIPEPPKNGKTFRVLFAGRVEENKGVFDLLEIAKRFSEQGIKEIVFDICGTGSALDPLRLAASEAKVEENFICHGYCKKSQMREMFGRSHVVIVPTRTDFVEGFNRVVGESILAHRPVVTSAVCPALCYVQDAVMEVPPNDIQAYGDALLELYQNPELYETKRQACFRVKEQFYDVEKSWGTALKSILLAIQEGKEVKELKTTSI